MAIPNELICDDAVLINSVRLAIRAEFSAVPWAFIWLDPCPGKRMENVVFGFRYKSGLIGVFDPDYKCPTESAGKQVVVERCTQPTDVEKAGGTRSKANADA